MGGKMDKISLLVERGGWIAPLGLLLSLVAVITAQPGFLSISCGGKTNHTAENKIIWVTDANYIEVGETADIGDLTEEAYGSSLQTLRFFPKPLNKSCYQLPVTPDVPYLLRLWFAVGNYTGFQMLPSFAFSIETVDMLYVENVTAVEYPLYSEHILFSSGRVLYICLIRTSEPDDPFISAIELRTFRDGMYRWAKPGTILSPSTNNLGGNSVVRYPQDKFDRIWRTMSFIYNISLQEVISINNTKDLPPTAVMQTAWVGNRQGSLTVPIGPSQGYKPLLVFYFAEIERLDMSESRSFYVVINGETRSEIITLVRNYSAIELTLLPSQIDNVNIVKAPNSTRSPILNAYEYHWLIATDQATYSQDVYALDAIKRSFDIKEWVSDPCYRIPWKGIGCASSSSAIRISEIYLSGRNLTGSVPKDIAQLTALVNLSLDNNHLMGSLPNLYNLTLLERLYLQNNNLSGTIEWLSEMKNLKELNIENNNLSGVIPAQLLLNCSLKLNYSGNPYLNMNRRECTLPNSPNNKWKVVIGITLSGILIITLGLIVGIVWYNKKFGRNKAGVATERNRVEKKPKSFFYQDYTMVMVPNPTKSRAFTLDEMIYATQNFSMEIGRGGFGSVFFGKLADEKDIAVKVLSVFSHQGVLEFLNEVDLLSRTHHRNLVSLLGYCNESREVMLIYEHMSGGSLRDHLYGTTSTKYSEQNWKTRLRIVLDAAHGLEYLHVGSTPKIIHRDVKTANILLDSNKNGKLADFGLSKMTIDGETTHVNTAVKGTAGYLDPEYYNTQMLTEKSDVYSFGVVLLEIICGRPPIDLKLPEHELNIIQWVTPYLIEMDENAGKITEIIDKRLGGSYDLKSISGVAKVAMRCVRDVRSSRPSVSEVVAELKECLKYEEIDIESGDLSASDVKSTQRKGMEWSDNSSNLSKVGR